MQYRLVRALDDRELVKKLLAMPITATTAKMLETCRTHITINGEMDAMGLGSSKDVHTIRKGPPKERPRERTKTGTGTETAAAALMWKLHQASRPRPLLLPSKRRPMPSMWEDWTLESEVPLQGQTVLLWTTRTPTQQGRQVQTETDP